MENSGHSCYSIQPLRSAEVLLKAGANPRFKSAYGVTPLSSAKAGKPNNGFSKATPEGFDRTIALFAEAEKAK